MKKSEEMKNTNRMAIKTRDNSKIYIDRINIDDKDRYIVSISEGAYINGVFIDDYSMILFEKMLIVDNEITIRGIIQENIAITEEYFVDIEGYLNKHIVSYTPMLEEYTRSRELFLELNNVEEICTDIDMFNDMMDDRLIFGKVKDLSKYGLYYPQVKMIDKSRVKTKKI